MIKGLYQYLATDELKSLLGSTVSNPRISPFKADNIEDYPYILYSISPFLAERVITQYRCEIKVVTNDMFLLEQLNEKVLDLMHFRVRSAFIIENKTIYTSNHVGGGLIFDPNNNVYEQTLIFNMKAK